MLTPEQRDELLAKAEWAVDRSKELAESSRRLIDHAQRSVEEIREMQQWVTECRARMR